MIPIFLRLILTPLVFFGDMICIASMAILMYGLGQVRGEVKMKDGTKIVTLFWTRELWRRPWFKNLEN